MTESVEDWDAIVSQLSGRSSAQLHGASDVLDRPAVTAVQPRPSRLPVGNEGRRRCEKADKMLAKAEESARREFRARG